MLDTNSTHWSYLNQTYPKLKYMLNKIVIDGKVIKDRSIV